MRASYLRSCLLLLGLLTMRPGISQQIFINEFLASNSNVLADEHGDFDDWAELYNAGTVPVDIGGMFVTDDLSKPDKWQIPATDPAATTIAPGGFLLLWFDREMWQGVLHVDAKLSADGEDIGLFASDGTPLDALTFGPQTTNISYGRVPDGGDVFQFFTTPTPGATNIATPGGDLAEAPVASVAGGFFTSNLEVSLTTGTSGAEIRYTLDGSGPSPSSALYVAPLQLSATTTLRARAFAAGMLPSTVTTHTYLFGGHTFPVVALSFQPEDFFDPATGIYPNYLEDWERPVHVEFFEEDGSLAFGQVAGVEIHGTGSAQLPQKSLRLKAKANAGSGFFQHPVFPDLPFDQYKSLILRNSGQDWNLTMFRDAIVTSLVGDLSDVGGIIAKPQLYLQGFRPGVAYLNGEYWGIHNLREHAKANYIEQHFGLKNHEIDFLDNETEASAGNFDAWEFFTEYLTANNFDSDDKMLQLGEFLDLPHFLDYNVFNILVDNADWPGNNNRRWRERANHAQWRFLTFDLDLSFGLLHIGPDSLAFNTGDASANSLARALDSTSLQWPNPAWATLPFRKTMENPRFRQDFINRTADFLNVLFDPARVQSRVDGYEERYLPEIQQHFDRWSPGWNPWADNVQVLRNFSEERPHLLRQHFVDHFGEITGTATVTLKAEPTNGGGMEFSTLSLAPDRLPWSGQYFTGVNIPVTAVPAPGYVFVGWSNPTLGSGPSANLILEGDETLIAYFEKGSVAKDPIVINEINYHSPNNADSGDWVELFNPNNHDVDISGWVFEDESGGYFNLPAGTLMPAGSFLVLVENTDAFSSVYPLTANVSGEFGKDPHGFKLSNSGELIQLKNASLEVIDSVRYADKSPWPTEPDGNGSTLQLLHWQLDNALPQSWQADLPTPGLPNHTTGQPQLIDFEPIGNKLVTDAPFPLTATATSGLPVTFSIVAGPATVSGNIVTLSGGQGAVTIMASQLGDHDWLAAVPVFRSFNVLKKPGYCEAAAVSPWDEWIERVQFGNLDHLSFKAPYSDFTHISAKAPIGQTLTLTVTPAFGGEVFEEYFRAWIDFNQNGSFDDAGEMVLQAIGTGAVSVDVPIPASAVPGTARLRVAMRRGQFPESCGSFDFGEVQDYSVKMMPDGSLVPGSYGTEPGNQLLLSPNPAVSVIVARFSTRTPGPVSVSMVDVLGVTVRTERFYLQEGGHLIEMDISALAAGRYTLLVSSEKQRLLAAAFLKMK